MMAKAKPKIETGLAGIKRHSSPQRRRLLGTSSAMAAALAIASMFSMPASAQQAAPIARADAVRTISQHRIPVAAQRVNGSPIINAPSAANGPTIVTGQQSLPTPIATRHYVDARGLTLDPPIVPSVPAAKPAPAPAPAPASAQPLSASFDTVRNAPTSTDFNAAKDGINARARAQYNSGQVDFRPDADGDLVELLTSNAIINWDTFVTGSNGNAVTFLGTGGKLGFTSALSDYTVLNRVFTGAIDSAIRIDGTVTSTVNGGAATGGNVWFYSPGGVIVGSTGAFNVGGLVLTSSQMDSIGASGAQMSFGGAADPGSSVVFERGADISTSNYLAIVAPRIEQHGDVSSAGSVAYVAAEQAQLTINNGLFDISVDVGTSDANGIVHSGSTSGPAANGGDPRAISMVAVPKNSAMTMLVGGEIGYQAAGGVSVSDDGKIILTAGEGGSINVSNARLTGDVDISADDTVRFGASTGGTTTASGDVSINAGNAGKGGGTIEILSEGTVEIAGNASLDASTAAGRDVTLRRGDVSLTATGPGASINIGGDLVIDASTSGIITEAAGAVVRLAANGTGTGAGISIAGDIAIDTSAAAGSDFITAEAGGTSLDANGGAISFGSLSLDAQASATGSALGQSGDGRNYRGGAFSLNVGEGGVVNGGALNIDSSAAGVDGMGGFGHGGSVGLTLGGGDLTLGETSIVSTGIGGDAPDSDSVTDFGGDPIGGFGIQRTAAATGFPSAGDGGDGIGGSSELSLLGGTANLASYTIEANGIGSDGANGSSAVSTNGGDGGDGIGGTASFTAVAGTLNVAGDITVTATGNSLADQGVGGAGNGSEGGNGGSGIGGNATFTLDGTATVTAGSIIVDASAYGGDGGSSSIRLIGGGPAFDPANDAGSGGNATGGTAAFNDISGNLTTGSITVSADAVGGAGGIAATGGGADTLGGDGGSADAGAATINLNRDDASGRDYVLQARAFGGDGGSGDVAGNGGNANGGTASLIVNGAVIEADTISADASAIGGAGGSAGVIGNAGGIGGDGVGGTAEIRASGTAPILPALGTAQLSATGTGGAGGSGAQGDATDPGGAGGAGGYGGGGTTIFAISGAGATFTYDDASVIMNTTGIGGTGGAGGDNLLGGTGGAGSVGGDAYGGEKIIEAGSGSEITLQPVSVGPFVMFTGAFAGTGGFGGSLDLTNGGVQGAGGDGGTGYGGAPTLRAAGGTITSGDVSLSATGFGGDGGLGGDDGNATLGATGNGGDGVGGTPIFETSDGSPGIISLGDVTLDASGIAGGGTVTGTTAGGEITITDGSADAAGLITMSSLTATATGSTSTPGTPSLTISGGSGPITVTGNVDATVSGDIVFAFDGDGQLDVGGTATLTADGAISGTHTNNPALINSIHTGTDIIATAGTDIDFAFGFVVGAGRDARLTAQNVTYGVVNALRDIIINATAGSIVGTGNLGAGRNIDLDATQLIDMVDASGAGDITIDAGTDITAGDVTLTGPDFLSAQRILINAGGDIVLGNVDAIDALAITGASLTADLLDGESISAVTTGLIDVGSANSESTIVLTGSGVSLDNGDAAQNITINATAGTIALGAVNSESQLIATATGDIGFTDITGLVVTLNSGGTISGGAAAADRAIISGTPRNVNLTATGAIDIDSASAIGSVVVNGASFTANSLDAGDAISVNTTAAINVGSTLSANETTLAGSSVVLGDGTANGGTSTITANSGLVDIGTFDTQNFVDITANTTVNFGTLTARALSINANGDVTGTRAATDVALISGRPRNVEITTAGAVVVDQIDTIGAIVVNAASLDSNLLDSNGAISVTVGGLADITQVNSGGSSTITGGSILIGDGVSGGLALLTSTAGNVSLGTWDSQGFLDIDSVQDAIFDALTGLVVDIVAAGDITGTSAATDVNQISGRARNVNLDAGGLVTIANTDSIGSTIVSGGAVNAVRLGASGSVTVTAAGAAEVDDIQSGGAATISGADVTLVDGNVGQVLTANAIAGDLAINGTMNVGQSINLDATGNVNFGALATTGGSLDANAGGDIIFNSASANIDVDLIAGGVVDGNLVNGRIITVNSGRMDIGAIDSTFLIDLDSLAGDIVLGSVTGSNNVNINSAGSIVLTDSSVAAITAVAANDITLGTLLTTGNVADVRLTAGGTASFTSIDGDRLVRIDAGAIQGGTILADAQTTLTAGTINVGDITADSGFVDLQSTTGDLVTGDLTSLVFGVQLDSAGNLSIGDSSGSNLIAVAANNAVTGDATFTGNININAGGTVSTGALVSQSVSPGLGVTSGGDADIASATANGLLTLNIGGALTGGDFSGSGVTRATASSIDINSIESRNGTLDVDATGAVIIDRIASAFGTTVDGGSITVNNGRVDGTLAFTATAGDISGTGTITSGGAITLDATGNIGFGTLDATNGNFRATAGGDINFVGASSNSQLTFTANGAVNGGDLTAGNVLTVDAGDIAIGDASGNVINLTSAADILFDSLTTPNALTVTAANGTIGANIGSGDIDARGAVNLNAQQIAVGDVTSQLASITAQATAGDASFGIVNALTTIDISAAGMPIVGGVVSGGNTTLSGTSITLNSGDIGGSLLLDAMGGDILLLLGGDDQILVGGSTALSASSDITVIHNDNSNNVISLDSAGNILAQAQGSFDAQAGSILSGSEVFVLAGGDASADDIRAVPALVIGAGGDVTLNNAVATGPQGVSNFSGIIIDAGLNPFGGSSYDNASDAVINGVVDSYSNITIRTGGNTIFNDGSATVANDRIFVQTGDDIVVGIGASVTSARSPSIAPDPSDPFNGVGAVELRAGGLTNLLSVPLTPIASILNYGVVDANGAAIIASANAIDGLNGTFNASSIALDINDAPNVGGTQSDDAGFLSANCVEGNICIGNIQADNIIEIGQASNNDAIRLFIEQGTVNANRILITIRDDIVMGTDGIATTLNATDVFSATSTSGDIDLRDADVSSSLVVINAAGSLLGSANLSADIDVGITVGGDIAASSINAGRELTSAGAIDEGAEEFFSTPGSIVVGNITVGGGDVNYTAGGDIDIGTLNVPGTNVSLEAGGLVALGLLDSADEVFISGSGASLGTIAVGGSAVVDVTGAADFGTVEAIGNIDISAGGPVTGGDLDALGALILSGSSIAIGEAFGNTIDLTSGSDILFDLLQSPNSIALSALSGTIGANTGAGDIETDGDASLTAQIIDVNDITSGGSVTAGATTGDATFGIVDAVTDITISAAGTPTIANAISGGNTSVTGASVTFNNGTVGGDLALTATAGDIDGNGMVNVSGGIVFDASGNVGFGSLDAQGGAFEVDAGGDIIFTNASSADFIRMDAGGIVQGGGLDAIHEVTVSGASIAIDEILAGGDITATAMNGGITSANLISDGAISLSATGDIFANHAEAGTDFTANAGGNFTTGLNSIITGGDVTIIAGGIANLGNSTAGGLIDVEAGQIDFANLIAGQSVNLRTVLSTSGNRNITGDTIDAGTDVSVDGGAIDLGQVDAGGSIVLRSLGNRGIVTGALAAGAGIGIDAGLDGFTGTTLDAGSIINLDSNGDVVFDNASANANLVINTINGNVTANSVFSGANVLIDAGGNLTLDSAGAATTGQGLVDIVAGGALTVHNIAGNSAYLEALGGGLIVDQSIDVAGLVEAYGESVFLRTPGDLTVTAEASDGTIDIEIGGNLDVQGAIATGDIDLTSTGGSAAVNAAVVIIDSVPNSGTQTTQQITSNGGNVTVTAAGDVVVNSFIDAADLLTIDAGGLLDLQATASGSDIEVLAADINIGTAGALGRNDRTNTILIAHDGDMYIGGSGGNSSGFELDNDEFSRIFSNDEITINARALSTGDGNITIDDLDVFVFSATTSPTATDGNLGPSGSLVFDAAASVDVLGNLTMTNARADNVLAIIANDLINIDVDSGNLRVEEDTSVLTGNIDLFGESIFAISASAAADISGASVEDIDLRLGQNDGAVRDEGYFQATNLTFNINQDLLIQNSGASDAFADRRGFVADNVQVNEIDALVPLAIVINGVVGGNTGVDAVSLVDITNAFDPASTVNGCLIANPSSCVVTITPDPSDDSIEPPIQDLIEEEIESDSPVGMSVASTIIEFRDDPERAPDPLINEPVTGAGNEDLWVSDEECTEADEACEVGEPELEPAE